MNTTINDCSAFPITPPVDPGGGGPIAGYPFAEQGMTLRDYFAAEIMGSFTGSANFKVDIDGELPGIKTAQIAYMLADAMLAARERKS